jgi:hypothetical protein
MVKYTDSAARELERIVEDITTYSITNLTPEQADAMYDMVGRLLQLRQYMSNVKFEKEVA